MEILKWLQEWYASQCDGDWEHSNGIKITSIDNPGWYVEINIDGNN
ncbi:Imm53 family immunity protein [Paenibacillus sp. JX-17]|uniref:Imm53 family immunity protein n=1 Tax=Paenibacillus lacisoli TaxID=3064525 RepID=A0ABT9CHN1_9BACL|nr:Imm53 family immunity protein [Paenibacillus sp. JX-17]MDO7908781.1 Imm53 family immunity protein [Paenibacillus sp. JX-17]